MTKTADQFAAFKAAQREAWTSFVPVEITTTPPAAQLVKFAQVSAGKHVLDVACGTSVVVITAALRGAKACGLDLTPALLERAKKNAQIAGVNVEFVEGDAEALPYPDASFDVVVSQFGHMFAPRPEVAVAEMRHVLKPTGRVAFATWPPEPLAGRMLSLIGRNSPPPPPGVAPPPLWGNPAVINERLAGAFGEPFFERGTMVYPALSLAHYRRFIEASIGPMRNVVEALADAPDRLARVRADFEALVR